MYVKGLGRDLACNRFSVPGSVISYYGIPCSVTLVFFNSYLSETYNKSLPQVLLKVEDVNCINVDWINGSLEYIHAVNNLRVVGAEVAYLTDVLMVRKVEC